MLKIGVQAANTYSGTLTTDHLMDEAIANAGGTFAALDAFVSFRDPDGYKPLARNQVKYVTSAGTIQTNPTSFETGDSVIAPIAVSMNHYSISGHTSNAELNSGKRQADDLPKLVQTYATQLVAQVTSLFTAANFPNAKVIANSGTFSTANAATAYGTIAAAPKKNLVLDSPWFASLNSSAGARGFQSGEAVLGWSGIYENSVGWSSADPNVHGIALGREAIVLIYGSLDYGSTLGIIARRYITLPCGLTIEHNDWFNPSTRGYWQSLDCVLGCAVADGTVGNLITSQ